MNSCVIPKHRIARQRRQTGVVLVISLIVLVALTLAGIALVRSTDTGNVISGNFAFRMSALHSVDTGVEAAFTAITSASGFAASPTVETSTTAGRYSPILLVDTAPADGLPDVDWSGITGTAVAGNTVKWVVERMCADNAATSVDIQAKCSVVPGAPNFSFKQGEPTPNTDTFSTAYRVTIRVEGPRNTVVTVQSVMAI